jgi:NAD(P)H-hydrate epimerase
MKKATEVLLFKKEHACQFLPPVSSKDHKSSRGRSLILAGSHDYPGAGVLAARGALRAGSGYVMLGQKDIAVSSLENPDFLLKDLRGLSLDDLKFDSVLLGPGFGVNNFTAELIRELKSKKVANVILDADALTTCVEFKLFPLPSSWIVTPHAGEMARVLGTTAEKVNEDRIESVKQGLKIFKCVVLLKGHGTLISDGGPIYRIASGNAALAKSGTGDVLAGMITAFRGQGLKPVEAALLGAYVHGATANLWVQSRKDPLSMTASDVVELVPKILWRLRSRL